MVSVWNYYKELKSIFLKKIKIPFIYILFLVDCFMLWKPEYISLINASAWVPDNLQKVLLTFFNFIYNHFLYLIIPLIIIIIIIGTIFEYTNFFRFLPKPVEMINGETKSWNPMSAIRKIIDFIFLLSTDYWIYWLTLNIFLNPHQFITNFMNTDNATNQLIKNKFLTADTLSIHYLLFFVNTAIAIVYVSKFIFEIRVPTNIYSIQHKNLDMYIEIASFEKNGTNTMILKPKYNKKVQYLLVHGDSRNYGISSKLHVGNKEIPYSKKSSKIINSSDNLSEIIYHFEYLKSK